MKYITAVLIAVFSSILYLVLRKENRTASISINHSAHPSSEQFLRNHCQDYVGISVASFTNFRPPLRPENEVPPAPPPLRPENRFLLPGVDHGRRLSEHTCRRLYKRPISRCWNTLGCGCAECDWCIIPLCRRLVCCRHRPTGLGEDKKGIQLHHSLDLQRELGIQVIYQSRDGIR